jgi:thiamine-monophosphate kinase
MDMDREHFLISRLSSDYIGDDGAVADGYIYSADGFFEGTHFLKEWMTPSQVGRKAMLVNISDAIAMNADPLYALCVVSLPRDIDEEYISDMVEAMQNTACEYGCEIIGGDTVAGAVISISVTLVSESDSPLTRYGLREGDLLAYTGRLGESARDLQRLIAGERIESDSRFYEPPLRREFVRKARLHLRAGMDISDGLYCDTNKLLDANRTGMTESIHIAEEIGTSGEEYEMLVAFGEDERENVQRVADECRIPLTIFGRVEKNGFRYPCKSHHFG